MSQTLLQNIEALLRKKFDFNDLKIIKILELFGSYRNGMWLYPGVLKRRADLSMAETYAVLRELEKDGIVKSFYELYCSHCQKSCGTVHVFNEIPEVFECELCHDELSGLENTSLLYLVIKDE